MTLFFIVEAKNAPIGPLIGTILVDYLSHGGPCPLTPQEPRKYNVSSSNFKWQILSRVKQISIFYKLLN